MKSSIDHVGILVGDLEQAIELFESVFGLAVDKRAEVPDKNVKAAFLDWGVATIELIEVAGYTPPAESGPINHLAVSVPDVAESTERARSHGIEGETPEPIEMAGRKTIFLLPEKLPGVRIQLVES
jgi:catechol 2,3-dioxygenase-like lactoylglutathione lyase family enzyme